MVDFDFFTPELAHSCLNRLRLRNALEMVDVGDQGLVAEVRRDPGEPGRSAGKEGAPACGIV